MKILVVDDDKKCCSEMATFLRQKGHQVDECSNELEAWTRLNSKVYEMLVSGIKLSEISEIEMIKAFGDIPNRFYTDIVLVSAHDDVEYAIRAIRAGASDYLIKPINFEELQQVTERIDRRHCGSRIKILLSIKNPIVKEGLTKILEQVNDFDLLSSVHSVKETLTAIGKTKPDIVIVRNNSADEKNALDLIKDQAQFRTIELCSQGSDITSLLKSNLDGVLSQEADINEIILAIKTVHNGIIYISPSLSEGIIRQHYRNDRLNELNEQEVRIMYYLVKGKTNAEIAQKLYMSPKTIKTYVSRIFDKLNVPNRAAAAVYAAKAFEKGYLSINQEG